MILETLLDYFIFFIITIKVVFSFTYFGHIILAHTNTEFTEMFDKTLLYWKEVTEFIFSICMSILLIYHFHPKFSRYPIRKETKALFLLFGIILLFSAKWTIFFDEDSDFIKILNKVK
jgi:hypothetical protein